MARQKEADEKLDAETRSLTLQELVVAAIVLSRKGRS